MGRKPKGLNVQLKDGGGSITLDWVSIEKNRHGNDRVYYRRAGKRVQLLSPVGSTEFIAEYQAVHGGETGASQEQRPATIAKSFRWLVEKYLQSPEYRQQSERSQYLKKMRLLQVCDMRTGDGSSIGDKRYADVSRRHVRAVRDFFAHKKDKAGEEIATPEAANERLKFLRQLFKWAIEALDLEADPTRDVPYLDSGTEGFHTWTIQEVEQYCAKHPLGTKARLALDLMLFTGVRRSDARRLGPQMERQNGTVLCWTEMKGRRKKLKERQLPILPKLRQSIDATPVHHLVYLATKYGKPFTPNGFGNWFKRRCIEAGLPHCSAHGLRKAGATIAADNGANEFELMAIYGWESPKEAARYTRKANRNRIAARAIHLIEPSED